MRGESLGGISHFPSYFATENWKTMACLPLDPLLNLSNLRSAQPQDLLPSHRMLFRIMLNHLRETGARLKRLDLDTL